MWIAVFTSRGDNSSGYENSHHPRCIQSVISLLTRSLHTVWPITFESTLTRAPSSWSVMFSRVFISSKTPNFITISRQVKTVSYHEQSAQTLPSKRRTKIQCDSYGYPCFEELNGFSCYSAQHGLHEMKLTRLIGGSKSCWRSSTCFSNSNRVDGSSAFSFLALARTDWIFWTISESEDPISSSVQQWRCLDKVAEPVTTCRRLPFNKDW